MQRDFDKGLFAEAVGFEATETAPSRCTEGNSESIIN